MDELLLAFISVEDEMLIEQLVVISNQITNGQAPPLRCLLRTSASVSASNNNMLTQANVGEGSDSLQQGTSRL